MQEVDTRTHPANWHSAALFCAAAIGLLGLFFVDAVAPVLSRLEHWTADWRTALLSDRLPTTHPKIAIVEVTATTLEPYPFLLPIDRGLQADIVSAVDAAGAKAIALDFYYTKNTVRASDKKLWNALSSAKAQVILGAYENRYTMKPSRLAYQYDLIDRLDPKVGYLNLHLDADKVVRFRPSPPKDVRFRESFSEQIAKAAGSSSSEAPNRIAWLLPPRDGSPTFLKIQAHNLLDGSAREIAKLKERVVIIAGSFPYFDRHRTPLSLLSGSDMNGADIHAQMAAEKIDGNRSYTELATEQKSIFLAGLASIGLLLGWRFHRRRLDFLDWRFVSFVFIVADAIVFSVAHIILPFTLAASAWLLSVTMGTQSWEALRWLLEKLERRA